MKKYMNSVTTPKLFAKLFDKCMCICIKLLM